MNRHEFNQCIDMIRSQDSMTYEEGYHWLQGYIKVYLNDLLSLLKVESDPIIRSKLVELIGDSEDPAIIPILTEELNSEYYEVRLWAYNSLSSFEDSLVVNILSEFRIKKPNEEFLQ